MIFNRVPGPRKKKQGRRPAEFRRGSSSAAKAKVQGARGGLGAPVGGFDWGLGWPEKLVGDGQCAAAGMSSDEGVPVREWWQEETGELRGFKVELARGSRGSRRACGGGSVMEQGSPEKKRG